MGEVDDAVAGPVVGRLAARRADRVGGGDAVCAAWPAHSGRRLLPTCSPLTALALQRARGYGRDAVEFRILGPLEVRTDDRRGAARRPEAARGARRPAAARERGRERASSSRSRCGARRRRRARRRPCRSTSRACARRSATARLLVTTAAATGSASGPSELDARALRARWPRRRGGAGRGARRARRRMLADALALWRGPPLADLAYEPFAQARDRAPRGAAARRARGAHRRRARARPPRRGGRRARGADRRAPATASACARSSCSRSTAATARPTRCRSTRTRRSQLVDELGIEPGERLRELERAILAQDPALARHRRRPGRSPRKAPPPPEAPPARRLVSVVVADIAGASALADGSTPSRCTQLLDRYADACGAVIERHGGTVEGFAGDAVVGVFGQAEVHEDDALRAVRAAVEMRAAEGRARASALKLGVEAGEVFVGAGARRSRFAAGSAFAVAARLEDAAPGRDPARPRRARAGRSRRAGRADSTAHGGCVRAERRCRPAATRSPFVGRERELGELRGGVRRGARRASVPRGDRDRARRDRQVAARARASPRCGSTRPSLVGGCPSYGEGVTYRPLAEIVDRLGGARAASPSCSARRRLRRMVLAAVGLVEGARPGRGDVLGRPAAARGGRRRAPARRRPRGHALGRADAARPARLPRRLLERASDPARLPRAARSSLESRPAWAAPQPDRSVLVLDPLPEDEARGSSSTPPASSAGASERIVETAEGNPLFLEQLVAVGAAHGELPTRSRPCSRRGSTVSTRASGRCSSTPRCRDELRTAALAELLPEAIAATRRASSPSCSGS